MLHPLEGQWCPLMETNMTFEQLKAKYPKIPAWMLDRGYTADQIDELMQLRQRAFPATKAEKV